MRATTLTGDWVSSLPPGGQSAPPVPLPALGLGIPFSGLESAFECGRAPAIAPMLRKHFRE